MPTTTEKTTGPITGPLAPAFIGSNGIGDFRRDVPSALVTGRTDETVTTAYIRPVNPTGFEVTLGTLAGFALPTLTARAKMTLARNVIRHEICHARYTDFQAIPEWTRETNNFPLLNVFEDIRIEYLEIMRLASTTFGAGKYTWKGFKWNWNKYTAGKGTSPTPTNALLYKKYGWHFTTISGPQFGAKSGLPTATLVREFFEAACYTATTRELFDVMREWIAEFPDNQSETLENGNGEGTLQPGNEKPGEVTGEIVGADCTVEGPPADTTGGSEIAKATWPTGPGPDVALVSRLRSVAETLLVQTDSEIATLGECGNRLHLPGIVAGLPSFKRTGGLGVPRLTLVCDMSNSMFGDWRDGLHEVAVALATAKGMETQVWLSGGRECEKVTAKRLATVFPNRGSESLKLTFATLAKSNSFGDLCVVLTDGQVGDGEVDAATYRSSGCNCVAGTVANKVIDLEKFTRQFGRVSIKPTPAELIRAIIYEARRVGMKR